MNHDLRGTGRITRMLEEVIAMLPNASMHPILVYCASHRNAGHIKQLFVNMLRERHLPVKFETRTMAS